jgi:hypothetical protein
MNTSQTEKKPMTNLTSDQLSRVRQTLIKCAPFRTERQLRPYFDDPRISAWQNRLPTQSESKMELVVDIISLLKNRFSSQSGENALVLFLDVVSENVEEDDLCQQQIATLAAELRGAIPAEKILEPPPSKPVAVPQNARVLLLDILTTYFDEGELKDLCVHMDLDFENLAGPTKKDKDRELVLYCERHNQMANLIYTGRQLRPEIDWPGYGSGGGGVRSTQKPALILHTQAGHLNIMLRQLSKGWQLELHNIGFYALQNVSLLLQPPTAVTVTPTHNMFGSLQPGETIQAENPIEIHGQSHSTNATCKLDFEIIYQTPVRWEQQPGYLNIPLE